MVIEAITPPFIVDEQWSSRPSHLPSPSVICGQQGDDSSLPPPCHRSSVVRRVISPSLLNLVITSPPPPTSHRSSEVRRVITHPILSHRLSVVSQVITSHLSHRSSVVNQVIISHLSHRSSVVNQVITPPILSHRLSVVNQVITSHHSHRSSVVNQVTPLLHPTVCR